MQQTIIPSVQYPTYSHHIAIFSLIPLLTLFSLWGHQNFLLLSPHIKIPPISQDTIRMPLICQARREISLIAHAVHSTYPSFV